MGRRKVEAPTAPEAPSSAAAIEGTKVDPLAWGSAQPKGKEAPLADGFEQIIAAMVVPLDEIFPRYQKLVAVIAEDEHGTRGTTAQRLDRMEPAAREAHCLLVTAKIEKRAWEIENRALFASMWSEATRLLEQERTEKVRTKAITNDDVEFTCASQHFDEYKHQEIRKVKTTEMVHSLENLVKVIGDKCEDLRVILNKQR
jgi:hypothetical protein